MDTPLSGESESKSPNSETPSKTPGNNSDSKKHPLSLIGAPYRWGKGQSGNPSGRPVRLPITEAYKTLGKRLACEVNPTMVDSLRLKGYDIPDDATMNDVLAIAQFTEAITGETKAASEITDRVEGKAIQRVELTGAEGGPVETVDLSRLSDEKLRLYEELQREIVVADPSGSAE